MRAAGIVAILLAGGCAAPPAGPPASGPDPGPVGIDLDVRLPGFGEDRRGELDLTFRIYPCAAGGRPVWEESRRAAVDRGRVRLVLGEVRPVPLAVHLAPLKFLGIAAGSGPEMFARLPVVQVAYASTSEALAARSEGIALGGGGAAVSRDDRGPATWREALAGARAEGKNLPGFRDWYRALLECPSTDVPGRTGGFEWVMPWVFDPGTHGALGRFFRGRPGGCRAEDLSPDRMYRYRTVERDTKIEGSGKT